MRFVGTLAFAVMAVAMIVILAVGASKPANAANTRIYIPLAPRTTAFGVETPAATVIPSVTSTRTATPTSTATMMSISSLHPANPSSTVTVMSSNNSIRLSLPPGLVEVAGQSVAVQFAVQPAAPPPSGTTGTAGIGLKSVDITMETLDGQQVSQLSRSMTIEFTYTEHELEVLEIDASQLQISYSSDGGVTWQTLATTIDSANLRAYAEVNHLTRFGLSGAPRGSVTTTATGTVVRTSTPTPTPTSTSTTTRTPVLTSTATLTTIPSPTSSPVPTETSTSTVIPTSTATLVPSTTSTATSAPSNTPTATSVPSNTSTATSIPSSTPTATSVPSNTSTSTSIPSNTPTATPVPSNTSTATPVPSNTSTFTSVPSNTPTATLVPSNTPTATYTATTAPSGSFTSTPSRTATQTVTPTRTLTSAPTMTPTVTRTLTPTPTRTATTMPTSTPTVTSTGVALISAWRINTSSTGTYFTSALTDVQSITVTAVAGTPEVKMNTNGIPSYSQTMSSSVRATLVARPNAATDFVTPSVPNIGVGTPVAFGQNIGFKSTTCVTPTTGAGYWPKGPACAAVQARSVYFPLTPVPAASNTSTSGGAIGYWVNGVSVYNWSDAQSYNSLGVWYRTAADWESYDMDIDYGHSTSSGDYHHHFYPSTLATQLGDTGTAHSPVYGFAADGYPIYGPWYASGVLAQSGWQKRDFDTPSATTGCGTARKRTCLMVDQTNKNGGTTAASSNGPDTNVTISTANGNSVLAVSGVYAQDYYHDATACTVSAACLDQYNGHTHDGLGYHYHVTVTQNGSGALIPAFPYILGLKFYGKLPGNSFAH